MHVNIGKRIKIEIHNFRFERDADTPGLITVRNKETNQVINLPANKESIEQFIESYRRCATENIEYREIKSE